MNHVLVEEGQLFILVVVLDEILIFFFLSLCLPGYVNVLLCVDFLHLQRSSYIIRTWQKHLALAHHTCVEKQVLQVVCSVVVLPKTK